MSGERSPAVHGGGERTDAARRPLVRVTGAVIVGSVLEWYDFFLFATAAAIVINKVYFPAANETVGTLQAFAVFAVGFFARPLGAAFFGNLGDRIGRKPALVATLLLMGLSTTGIGVLPSYASIGIWAPALLVVLRVLQGFGAGAELSGAAVMSVEYAPRNRKGLFGAWPLLGVYAGLLAASATFSLLTLMPDDAFLAWGWRLPFLASIVLVGVGLFVRARIGETPAFEKTAARGSTERVPLIHVFRLEWRGLLAVAALIAAIQSGVYVYSVYAVTYATDQLGIAAPVAVGGVTISALVAVFAIPAFGALSDRVGRRPVYGGGALLSGLCAFPFFWLLGTKTTAGVWFAIALQAGVLVPMMAGVQGALFSELFRTRLRYSGFAIGRETSTAVFGGLAPFVSTAVVAATGGASWPVALFLMASCVLTLVAVAAIPETYQADVGGAEEAAHA